MRPLSNHGLAPGRAGGARTFWTLRVLGGGRCVLAGGGRTRRRGIVAARLPWRARQPIVVGDAVRSRGGGRRRRRMWHAGRNVVEQQRRIPRRDAVVADRG